MQGNSIEDADFGVCIDLLLNLICCKYLREDRSSSIHVQEGSLFLEQKYRLMAFELQRGAVYSVNFHVAGLYKQDHAHPWL